MGDRHLVIVGGGLAGLSAGVYARRSGFKTTIVEHNLALGGVCTAWQRGPYMVDGCIHWLTGGPFQRANAESLLSHVKKKLAGLDGFDMAGQWVEPGGGVPTAVMSGRHVIQLACKDEGRPFVATGRSSV